MKYCLRCLQPSPGRTAFLVDHAVKETGEKKIFELGINPDD